jgi:Type II secretion system (T2SS), protein E, N-terminal domain
MSSLPDLPAPTRLGATPVSRRSFGRRPLGELLVDRGLLTREQLAGALAEAEETGQRIGVVLVDKGWVFPNELAHAIAQQLDLPYVDIAATSVDPKTAALLPRDFAEYFGAVPVRRVRSGAVLIAVADPTDVDLEVLRIAVGHEIELGVAELAEIRNAWRHCP